MSARRAGTRSSTSAATPSRRASTFASTASTELRASTTTRFARARVQPNRAILPSRSVPSKDDVKTAPGIWSAFALRGDVRPYMAHPRLLHEASPTGAQTHAHTSSFSKRIWDLDWTQELPWRFDDV